MKNIFLALMLVLGVATLAFAVPVLNDDGSDGYEDYNGTPFSRYVNSGQFLFLEPGNVNDNPGSVNPPNTYGVLDLQNLLHSRVSEFSGVVLTVAGVADGTGGDYGISLTGAGGSSGTWMTNPDSNYIEFYVVKAADAFAMYYVNPADNYGSWSTFDLWDAGYGGNSLNISHFIGYNPSSTPVPEPGTIMLIGVGLVGIALYGRKRINS